MCLGKLSFVGGVSWPSLVIFVENNRERARDGHEVEHLVKFEVEHDARLISESFPHTCGSLRLAVV